MEQLVYIFLSLNGWVLFFSDKALLNKYLSKGLKGLKRSLNFIKKNIIREIIFLEYFSIWLKYIE